MLKQDRIQRLLEGAACPGGWDARYAGYFARFNRGEYYEAHDVLENLWLAERGPDRSFYQGLIQLAGAFVHLRKQAERPWHPKDGARLAPAARLLALADARLAAYPAFHRGLDLGEIRGRIAGWLAALQNTPANPWSAGDLPQLVLANGPAPDAPQPRAA
jgi:predicted metal-dependent hydrolase